MSIQTINPATGNVIQKYNEMSTDEALQIAAVSHRAFLNWREKSFAGRGISIKRVADLLEERQQECGRIITSEMGKPLEQSIAEIKKCAALCRHYVECGEDYLAPRTVKTEMLKSKVTHEPLGVVFGIMPWNFPFWQVFRFAIPALLAGNGALLKHASISTGTALAIEKLFADSGMPENVFRTLVISNNTSAKVMASHHVAAVTFTGSVTAGRIIASEAGKALKKTVMELGGCDGYVVLADANLEQAAEACVTSRMLNAGQSCIAAKRLIVVEAVHDQFVELVQQKMQHYQMGDPMDEATTMGPLSRADIREDVHSQVQQSIAAGAKLLMGGVMPDMTGFYYPPTLLTQVGKGMPAYDQEIFGPVISILKVKDEAEAIQVTNSTTFGLGAAVFTRDLQRGEEIATKQLQAGTCVVNTFVVSDARLPFGGIKDSGYGRELSQEGILSFVNTKTVNVASA